MKQKHFKRIPCNNTLPFSRRFGRTYGIGACEATVAKLKLKLNTKKNYLKKPKIRQPKFYNILNFK